MSRPRAPISVLTMRGSCPPTKERITATLSSRSCLPCSEAARTPYSARSCSLTIRARCGELTKTSAFGAGSIRAKRASASSSLCGGLTHSACTMCAGSPLSSSADEPNWKSLGASMSCSAVRRTVGVSAVAEAKTSCNFLRSRMLSIRRSVGSTCGGRSASSTSSITTCRTRWSLSLRNSKESSHTRPAVPTSSCGRTFLSRST
mmetsp:Transcript_30713/g.71434  ORF Transcript_30713/g.71434 Transcript_30713/m.71434 type:complete len:204 (+) Transcript_30713:798-1409(+)